MGMFSSTSGDPSIADTGSSYMSKISRPNKRFKFSDMATSMDTQMPHQDSLSHDTLMGLQELDSHLSMFDTSNLGRESSTPGAMSNSGFEEAMRTVEKPSHVIVIDPPDKDFSPDFDSDIEVHPNSFDQETYGSIIVQSEPVRPLSHGHLHLKPESARDSLASTTMTENSESSSLASISSKSTSPPAADLRGTSKSLPESKQRPKYNVRPRISIPADIHPSEYARQCIAAAESSRLSPYSLHPEEHAILRTHLSPQQVTTYLNIRNGILRLWTRNPMIRVMRDEAVGCAKDARWFDVASVCHEWLSRRGYINYGCLEHVEPTRTTKRQKTAKRKRKTIAVIGAGMAGLGCARQLEGLISQFEDRFREMGEDPPNVVVLEGRDRIGGRVYSRPFRSKPETPSSLRYGSRCTAEMGGMIITGFDRGNPLNIIVRGQLALPYHALRSETELYDTSGKAVEYSRDQCAEKLFNYILERVSEYKFKVPPPPQVDGDKDAVDAGRDSHREGSKTIAVLEDAGEILSSTKRNGQFSKTGQVQMIPVSSDRLTGRAHIEPGVPAVHTAAYKAKEIGWTLRPGVGIEYDLDLETAVTSKYATFGSVFDEALHQFERIIDFAPLDLRLINWHVANLEYSNATTINRLSLGGWDLDAGNEWEGKHTMVIGGYQQVPRGLLNCPQPLTVRKKAIVKSIVYNPEPTGNPSKIICEDGQTVEADYIVSTIPLGVLKANDIQFEPELPDWKLGPISRLGFGVLNKIVLVYKEPFWDTKRDIFGTLRNAPIDRHSLKQADYFTNRGRFFQWFNCTSTSGLPSLLVLMAGDAAFWAEDASNDQLVEEATSVLRSVFGQAVPNPVEAVATKWGKDLFSRGSYSYTGPNLRPDDYEIMAKPIGNLFFGGEHTCGTHPATVHGAYISGLRAASEVLEAMIGPISIPQPLIVPKDSSAKRKSADSAQSSQDLKLTRREAYDNEVWIKTLENVGERPLKPANNAPNPYRLYCKDKWDEAKQKCNEGRRPNKGKAVKNEVKTMVTAMWKKVSAADKKPWEDRAEAERKTYQMALEDWKIKDQQWVVDYEGFRKKYMEENPLVPGPDEDPFADERRDRRAKRVSGYKEPDDDDVDFE